MARAALGLMLVLLAWGTPWSQEHAGLSLIIKALPQDSPVPMLVRRQEVKVEPIDPAGLSFVLQTDGKGVLRLPIQHRGAKLRLTAEPKCASEVITATEDDEVYLICQW